MQVETIIENNNFINSKRGYKCRIFPSWDQINKFKPPLSEGEFTLAQYLDNHLPQDWEIFIQPFLNGDRPDIVLMNKNVGIMIIEVKDYRFGSYYSKTVPDIKTDKNYVKYYVRTKKGNFEIGNPVYQVNRYKKKILSLYVPQMGELMNENRIAYGCISTGIYFHNMTTLQAHDLVKDNRYCNVFGSDFLNNSKILNVVPATKYSSSKFFKIEWSNKIRHWLLPPFHSIEQGKSIKLTNQQKKHTKPEPNKHQRLRGVAGSGKTMVIAQRAANLASQGKKVLIVTYNITLWHVIKDFISRARVGFSWGNIEFNHFHGFCKDYMDENNFPWPNGDLSDKDWLEVIPEAVQKIKKSGININDRKYDAILIDEGQDYHKSWYETLILFLSKNDEILFVIDEKQNIYDRDNLWVNKMSGTKFMGRWRTLSDCFRLPFEISIKALEFSKLFLGNEGVNIAPRNNSLNIFESKLTWSNLSCDDSLDELILKQYNYYTKNLNQHPSDIAILVPNSYLGTKYVNIFFKKIGVRSNHIFETDGKLNYNNKKSFYMGDGRLKISTIQSFKGWEIKNLIIVIPSSIQNTKKLDRLVYTSLTRTLSNISIFNLNSRYFEYGDNW